MIFDLQSTLKLSFSLVVSHFQQLHISAIKTIPKQCEKKEQLDEKGGGGGGGRGGWRRWRWTRRVEEEEVELAVQAFNPFFTPHMQH